MRATTIDEEKADKLTRKIFFVLSVFFFVVLVINISVQVFLDGIILNYEFLTPLPSTIVLFCLFGFFFYVYLMLRWDLWGRVVISILAVLGVISSAYMSFFTSQTCSIIQQGVHTIYIEESRFLFAGTDYLYYKENFLWSHYLGSAYQCEECYSTYEIQGDTLLITENWESGTILITEIDLSD